MSGAESTGNAVSRSEHYAESSVSRVRQSRARVCAALERHAVGRENAIHGTALADVTPLKDTTVRDIIAELRDDPEGPPIGNCSDGYYVIDDPDQLAEYVEGVKETIQTKRDRMQANVKAFNRERYGGGEA